MSLAEPPQHMDMEVEVATQPLEEEGDVEPPATLLRSTSLQESSDYTRNLDDRDYEEEDEEGEEEEEEEEEDKDEELQETGILALLGLSPIQKKTKTKKHKKRKKHAKKHRKKHKKRKKDPPKSPATKKPLKVGPDGKAYSRKEKSLGLLTTRFIEYCSKLTERTMSLDEVSAALSVVRRRIYDVVNVLQSVGVVHRRGKNKYAWRGLRGMISTVTKIEKDPAGYLWGPDTPQKKRGESLGALSKKYVALFLLSTADGGVERGQSLSLETSARKMMSRDGGVTMEKAATKTKVRRLYDVANIFCSLGLIGKKKVKGERKPGFVWIGPKKHYKEDHNLELMPPLEEDEEDSSNDKPSKFRIQTVQRLRRNPARSKKRKAVIIESDEDDDVVVKEEEGEEFKAVVKHDPPAKRARGEEPAAEIARIVSPNVGESGDMGVKPLKKRLSNQASQDAPKLKPDTEKTVASLLLTFSASLPEELNC